jgi:hypothetical protein
MFNDVGWLAVSNGIILKLVSNWCKHWSSGFREENIQIIFKFHLILDKNIACSIGLLKNFLFLVTVAILGESVLSKYQRNRQLRTVPA